MSGRQRTLVVVAAHPDDEVLSSGALLLKASAGTRSTSFGSRRASEAEALGQQTDARRPSPWQHA